MGLQRASKAWPLLSLYFYPQTFLCASCLSASLVPVSKANLMPPLSLHQRHRVDLQASATGWLVEAGLLCVKLPHCYQKPSGGLLEVIRWPPWPPLCLLSLPGGQHYMAKNVCRVVKFTMQVPDLRRIISRITLVNQTPCLAASAICFACFLHTSQHV